MKFFKKSASILLATTIIATSGVSVAAVKNTQQENKFSAGSLTYVNENGDTVSNIDYSKDIVPVTAKSGTLPKYYNSADYGYVTSVKNQGNTGTCWSYAAIAAIESSLIINNGYSVDDTDLSELHLAYSSFATKYDKLGLLDSYTDLSQVDYLNFGGDDADPIFTLANWQGVVSEDFNNGQFSTEKFQLRSASQFDVYNKEALYNYNEAVITDCYRVPFTNPDLVKQHIMDYGSAKMSINGSICYENYDNSTFYCYDSDINYSNHAVNLVGWDDDYPKENFTVNGHTPKNDGAWIIKNSWGEYSGVDGYNWISYEDYSIKRFAANFYALDTQGKYNNNYQYDDLPYEQVLCDNSADIGINSDGYMANVYTAQNDNEQLKAVAFVTSHADIDYKIDIYTNVNSNPTDGVLSASINGNMPVAGYHTVDLETPVNLAKGEKFAVVIYLGDSDNPDRTMYFNIDGNNVQFRPWSVKVSDYGESFFSYDGKNWDDLKNSLDGNFRIKALTTSDEVKTPMEDYYNSYNGMTREECLEYLNEVIKGCYDVLGVDFVYSEESYDKFSDEFSYAQEAAYKSELFQAIELYHIAQELKDAYDNLQPYSFADELSYYYDTIVENVQYYKDLPCWEKFINTYNSLVEESKTLELNKENSDYLISTIEPVFMEYMTYAVNHGCMKSFLQEYGDVDNTADVNIQDATTTQMFIAKLKDIDYFIANNADVDGDGKITIKDATYIQMKVSKLLEYFPIFNKEYRININFPNNNGDITYETAVSKLQTAVRYCEESYDFRQYGEYEYILKSCLYYDAKEVLENTTQYSPQEINFKADYIVFVLYNMV